MTASRRATIRTSHDHVDAHLVARALAPDNTDEMETTVDERETESEDGAAVVTHIERETTGGLHATVDDYVVNLEVAVDVARSANSVRSARSAHSVQDDDADEDHSADDAQPADPADTGTVSDQDRTHDTQ